MSRGKNLNGQVFGHLKVLYETKDKKGHKAWMVECDCENKTQLIVSTARLTSGLKTHCGCRKEIRDWSKVETPIEYVDKKKICGECGEEKEYKEFYFKEYINTDGVKSYIYDKRCIKCNKEKAKIRNLNHREEHLKAMIRNRHRPSVMKAHREDAKRRRDVGLQKQYQEEHPEKLKEYALRRATKNHKVSSREWKLCKEYFNNQCAYCGLPIEEHYIKFKGKIRLGDFHREHAIHDGANDLSNYVPSCKSCNSEKSFFKLEDWYNENNSKFTKERLEKIYKWINEDYKQYINYI